MLHARDQAERSTATGGAAPSGTLSDVRANIARLEARARTMLSGSDGLIMRSGRSVLELSKATLAEVSRRPSASSLDFQHTPVELFMANLGFDVQEQQRLLQHLQMNQPLASGAGTAYDDEDGALACNGGAAAGESAADLESFLANRRSESLQRCVDEVHRQISDRTRELAEQQIRTLWERRSDAIVDSLEGRSLGAHAHPSTVDIGSRASVTGSVGTASHVHSTSSRLVVAKMHAFSHIVDVAPPQEWCAHFNAFVQDTTRAESDEIAALWSSVNNILSPISQAASSSSTVSVDGVKKYVASSRLVLERKYLASLFADVLKIPASKFDEMEHTHATKMVDMIEQFAGRGADTWSQVFIAMRCGRYDAAQLIAGKATGLKALQNALCTVASTPPLARNELKPFQELRQLFLEDATRSDHYRMVVLYMLLVGSGSVGSDAESAMSGFITALDKVSTSIEDMIWMRLMCIRHVDASPPVVQSLVDLQKSVLSDVPHLLALPNSSVVKVASVLFFTLLPSTALRLLQDSREYTCDAVHLALSFHVCHLLRCTASESQLNMSSMLHSYALKVLELDDPRASRHVASALFRYFNKSDQTEAFVDLCRSPVVCVKLFGQLGDTTTNEGALLHGSAACQPELLSAMDAIADAGAASGHVEVALHMLLVLDRLATQQRDTATSRDALQKAILILNPALSHSAHHGSQTAQREGLILHARRLRDRLQHTAADLSTRDVQAFYQLCSIAEFHSAYHRGDYDQATQIILQLRFIPTQASEVDEAAEYFNVAVCDDVVTAMPPTILLFLKMELAQLQKMQSERTTLVQMAKAVIRWVSKWRFNATRKDLMKDLQTLEGQFSA